MSDSAIAISTYITDSAKEYRTKYLQTCVTTLIKSKFDGQIFIVDDCSPNREHIDWLKNLGYPNLTVYERSENGGIAKTKNTSIRLCIESGSKYFFLSDDDMYFKKENWWKHYEHACRGSKVPHFSFTATGAVVRSRHPKTINGFELTKTSLVDGCFLFCKRELIDLIGYFVIMPTKYGHEHSNFSVRAQKYCGGFFDLNNSMDLVGLYELSSSHKSVNVTTKDVNANAQYVHKFLDNQPCIE